MRMAAFGLVALVIGLAAGASPAGAETGPTWSWRGFELGHSFEDVKPRALAALGENPTITLGVGARPENQSHGVDAWAACAWEGGWPEQREVETAGHLRSQDRNKLAAICLAPSDGQRVVSKIEYRERVVYAMPKIEARWRAELLEAFGPPREEVGGVMRWWRFDGARCDAAGPACAGQVYEAGIEPTQLWLRAADNRVRPAGWNGYTPSLGR